MSDFTGMYVIVTGGGTGIGRAIALRFAADGASVAVLGRRPKPLEETVSLMADNPDAHHLVVPTDISSVESVDRAAEIIADEYPQVDVIVNNAGVARTADPVETDLDEWMFPIKVNMMGVIHCVRAFSPMIPKGGRIINVTSIHRERVEMGCSAYATAKGAINQYTRAMALEFADRGILVNAVAPGFVDTPMSRDENGMSELETEWFDQNYVSGHHLALRRAGRPEEIAGVTAFLAGPDATYITGETITVDGGLTITF